MSIQNRLLFVYTAIFLVAFLLFATIVYFLPRNRIVAQIDSDLAALAAEIQNSYIRRSADGVLRIVIPPDLNNLETASTFLILADVNGQVVVRSSNLVSFHNLLDPEGIQNAPGYAHVSHGDTHLRVLTMPLYDQSGSEPVLAGYLQVGRLFDSIESFNRFLIIALFMGFAAAIASLFLAVLLTPGSFKPLEDIANVARQITNADDLSRRVPDTGRTDEIGVLTRSINQTLERLERLFQTQQRLLADVSHELRTPLTAIRGNLDVMQHMGEADPQSLEIIREEVDRMTRLVGDLLLLARADAGGLPLARNLVELDAVFFEVYRQINLLQKSVEVTVTAVDQACIMGDADRLKQLLLNLIGNAIKYTPDGGKVTLSLSKSDGWAYIHVSDNGIGIPPQDLPYIFDRFYRVDKARSRIQGGSGLGLSIARWIARAHGGDIDVTSKVGEGSTFIVSLPVLETKKVPASLEEEIPEVRSTFTVFGSPLRRKKIDSKAEVGNY